MHLKSKHSLQRESSQLSRWQRWRRFQTAPVEIGLPVVLVGSLSLSGLFLGACFGEPSQPVGAESGEGRVSTREGMVGATLMSGGASPIPAACPEASQLSDEFEAACSLSAFAAEQQTYVTTDVDGRVPGQLVVTFEPGSPAYNGWYQNWRGPGLFKGVAGNFIVRTAVNARSQANPDLPPSHAFNSAGLLVRDPASVTGNENWVMYDLGFQNGVVGTESKTTQGSSSVLTIHPTDGRFAGELVVCREGADLRMFRRQAGDSSFTMDNSFSRPDLPGALEAGLIVNGWENPPDIQAEFDYFRVETQPAAGDCSVAGLNALYPPNLCPAATGFSDEFDDGCSLSAWTGQNLGQASLDIDTRTEGHLTLTFDAWSNPYYGWYQDYAGPFLHKSVTGNFLVSTRLNARSLSDPSQGPTSQYNSAGILARDPSSVAGNENWLVYNLGYQENSIATEGKTTDNSVSVLTLLPTGGIHAGELAMCRFNEHFRLFRRLDGETSWHQEHDYARADLPATLDVGLMANAWQSPATIRAEYDYIRLQVPTVASDCSEAGLNALLP